MTTTDAETSTGAPPGRASAPALASLAPILRDEPAIASILGRSSAALSVPEPARAIAVAGISASAHRRPMLVAVSTSAEAERLAGDLVPFVGADAVELFPAWETLPFERVSPQVQTMGRRLRTMWRLHAGAEDPSLLPAVVVAPARALLQRLSPHVEDLEPIIIRPGDVVDPTALAERLVEFGYRREYQVEHRGEFAVRGSIVDVFGSTEDHPVRIDLWGDDVERLCSFSVADQRAEHDLDVLTVFAARELLATPEIRERADALVAAEPWARDIWERLADGQTFDGMESWLGWLDRSEDDDADGQRAEPGGRVVFDLLGPDGLVVLVDPLRLRQRSGEIIAEEVDLAASLAPTWDRESGGDIPRLHVDYDRLLTRTTAPVWAMTTLPEGPDVATVQAAGWHQHGGDGTQLTRQLTELGSLGYRIVVAADGAGSAERLDRLLREHGVAYRVALDGGPTLREPGGHICVAPLSRGTILPALQLAVISEADLTGRRRTHRAPRTRRQSAATTFEDLTIGAYVVHHHHGVARYAGMVTRAIGGIERDYLLLEYRGDDRLYVPSDQIDAVRPYSGGETPRLSKMGGSDFAKAKAAVRAEVAQIAQELVVLYQKRRHAKGVEFQPDTPWQREMEEAFPFTETVDQLRAINDVKEDMESSVPMDRLVCGDVGFGKTEVAIRAAFKAVQDGRQVAILVPTTLLAQQHFATFSERFAPYPVRVEVLSRFLSNAEARKVAAGLRSGEVDVVIGTHRLLSGDIEFKNLGLLVIDEEQRFGVSHKEAIKALRTDIDVLTLTATPIPRTLEMSLTGIRDLSLLNTPPAERQPILTYVGAYDERAVAEAVRRELLREGQVFFVHNRVADIEHVAGRLAELVPEARIAVAHGQMDEGTLERVVLDFWEGDFDVLVCTTIIESGIDMPTVNTLVVDRADLLGLGQMHQLRGRVGRAGQRAYAYLFHPRDRELTEEAFERLRTIGETTELGSGFRIAMRDLEIRGAGNLLGTGQSGHIASVGYDLYVQMVNEAITELNGETVPVPAEIKVEVPLDANIPADYIAREDLRLDAYRRLAEVKTLGDVDDIAAEWVDRYGPVPQDAAALLSVGRLRAECRRTGVLEITVTRSTGIGGPPLVARVTPVALPTSKQMRLERLFKGSLYKPDALQAQLPVRGGAECVDSLLTFFAEIVPDEAA